MMSDLDNNEIQQHHKRKAGRSRTRSVLDEKGEYAQHSTKRRRHEGHHGRKEETGEEAFRPDGSGRRSATLNEGEDRPLFFVDRKGDPQNVVFGGNHTGILPRYRKSGCGSLIGLDRGYKISKDGSKACGIGFPYDNPARRSANSLVNFRDDPRLHLEQVRAKAIADTEDFIKLQQEYIVLETENRKRRKRNVSHGRAGNGPHVDMGWSKVAQGDGNMSPCAGSSSESDSTSSIESNGEEAYEKFRSHIHRQQLIELNRAIRDSPEDVDAWLALIAHQDLISCNDDYALSEITSAPSNPNLAEIKLGLYEKALTRVTDTDSRERLLIGLMDQAAAIHDVDSLSRKWQAVLGKNPSTNLGVQYLNFIQTASTTFSFEECLCFCGACLRRARDETQSPIRDAFCIYIILRITTLMSQCGYLERATAIWQGLLEFTFFRPKHLYPLLEHVSFQAFWESEIPRIGELGATGWAVSNPFEVPSRSDSVKSNTYSDDIHERWAMRESETATFSVMPARTVDDVAENDPFRVILYSDIADYLLRPSTETGHRLLINAFLKFCGLPALHHPSSQTHRRWWNDEFISSVPKDQPSLVGNTAVSDARTLFPVDTRLSVFSRLANEDGTPTAVWQDTAMRQLVAVLVDDTALAEYVIAFKASIDAKEGRKYAKNLLKSQPSNLRLYNTYALLECRLGRFESAEHVWLTATTMCQSASLVAKEDLALLWSSWVFECLQQGNVNRAKDLLSSMINGQNATGLHATEAFSNALLQLRTKNYIESHLSQQLSLRQEDNILHLTELLAMFEYLAGSQSISAALRVYNTTFETLIKISASSLLIETLHQSRAYLLDLHPALSPGGYRPAEINRSLGESLRTFPGNSMFYQLYQEHTQRTGLLERIREVVPTSAMSPERNGSNTLLILHLFSIQAEISRPSYAGSTNHSIRAAFERGVAAAKASVRIWAWYVKWESSLQNETDPVAQMAGSRRKGNDELRQNLKQMVEVYYRGIRACAWAKDLYMLAFSEKPLRQAIGGVELRKIYDTMLDKGLRIHVDLDQLET